MGGPVLPLVRGLNDQAVLKTLALGGDKHPGVRREAIERIEDQALLTKLALNQGEDPWVRRSAAERLTDAAALESLKHEARDELRSAAFRAWSRLEDANFAKWRQTGEPKDWVRSHSQGWNHSQWLELLGSLRQSSYWPISEFRIGECLEAERVLIADPDATARKNGDEQ